MEHPVRIELANNGPLGLLANHLPIQVIPLSKNKQLRPFLNTLCIELLFPKFRLV